MQPARNASFGTILARAVDRLSRSLGEVRFFVLPDFVDGSDHDCATVQRKPKVSSRSHAPRPGYVARNAQAEAKAPRGGMMGDPL